MQEVDHFGRYGTPIPFDAHLMSQRLDDPDVDHMEVFLNTPAEMERRRQLHLASNPVNRKAKKKRNKMQRKSRKISRKK